MDYEVGSVAALISGDVTPNRPKLVRKALTPIKHQPSPNVTPKSEFVDDRSIFLSPSLQKKKAIVKKSPKRIFQNPDLDVTFDNINNSSAISPKADKVKKHLEEDLGNENSQLTSPKLPRNKRQTIAHNNSNDDEEQKIGKAKKKKNAPHSSSENISEVLKDVQLRVKNPKKKADLSGSLVNTSETKNNNSDLITSTENVSTEKKKNKKRKSTELIQNDNQDKKISSNKQQNVYEHIDDVMIPKKKKKTSRKSNSENKTEIDTKQSHDIISKTNESLKGKSKKNKSFVNPNAITDKDSDSEHDSDNEIESETEHANNEILDTGPVESSDEEESPEKSVTPKVEHEPATRDEIKRTLFVGNVPFSNKCKKEVKKIFSKYGAIETIRIRTVPVKDARVTPKLAVIKNELHPERSTVNVYIKFKEPSSVEEALIENNTVLNDHHLRVSRSDSTGAEHDPRLSVFVGNLPFALEDEGLREKFNKCGEIVSVRIIRDKKTNAGKGFGYVNFASKDGVELALALTDEDLTIKNRILRVKRCTQVGPKNNNQKKSFKGKQFNQGGRYKQNNQGRNFSRNNQGKNITGNNRGRKFSDQKQSRNFSDQGRNFSNNQGENFQGKNPFGRKPNFSQRQNQYGDNVNDGAQRRIMNKRKNQDGGEGLSNNRLNTNGPPREKKVRRDFVGMTSEKKKKHTFNKGDKKKKVLSEILANK